ncbi:Methionine aminopeptidase 1 [Mycoemilia scoparia]|uniref:Methionine aminopeptidase n=1 Tax=Mycoemilia scoparia TaxID=417184 RepID=A0A9W8A6C6_9FUNG|nr:Methionine aminopeptidase 1 [Mycoemilia scoparia]
MADTVAMKLCESNGCDKPAALQCPNCIKLKLDPVYFCSQACFSKSWGEHKSRHNVVDPAATYDPFPSFKYTGELRPVYPLSPRRPVPEHIPRPDYASLGRSISEERTSPLHIKVLGKKDIEGMRKVCRLAREVLDEAARALKPGITTDEIDQIVHDACIVRDSYPSPLNYYNFPKSVCTSINEVVCHGIPDRRPLKDGDIINIDVTLYHGGYHGDLNATYTVGENVDEKAKELIKTTRECMEKAIAMVKPGTRYRDLGTVIEKHAKSCGFSVVKTYCGHGIHNLFHCGPTIAHYAKNKTPGIMKEGHCFTIEPMINEGEYQDITWPDQWTAVTKDGKRSAQFEHTMLVTKSGVEILTAPLADSPPTF